MAENIPITLCLPLVQQPAQSSLPYNMKSSRGVGNLKAVKQFHNFFSFLSSFLRVLWTCCWGLGCTQSLVSAVWEEEDYGPQGEPSELAVGNIAVPRPAVILVAPSWRTIFSSTLVFINYLFFFFWCTELFYCNLAFVVCERTYFFLWPKSLYVIFL